MPLFGFELPDLSAYSGKLCLNRKCWELLYVEKGGGYREMAGVSRPVESGMLTLVPPEIQGEWNFTENTTCMVLRFAGELPQRLAAVVPELDDVAKFYENGNRAWDFRKTQASTIGAIMASMRNESPARRAASVVEILTRIAATANPVVAGTTRHMAVEEERRKRLDCILGQAETRSLTLDSVSVQMGMSRTAFCNLFKKLRGETFIDYLNRRKVSDACRMLRNGKHTLRDVCEACGFGSLTYFIRVFGKTMGETPSRWSKKQ